MKIVKESLLEFHKGTDPLTNLGLGPYVELVHSIFDACGVPRTTYRIEGNKTYFDNELYLNHCRHLEKLPNGLNVNGYLYLDNCVNLAELPSDLNVGGNLNLRNCKNLEKLPDNLNVVGSLQLRGCDKLTKLPGGLSVGHWLGLEYCVGLTELPSDLTVEGKIYARSSQTELVKFIYKTDFRSKLILDDES